MGVPRCGARRLSTAAAGGHGASRTERRRPGSGKTRERLASRRLAQGSARSLQEEESSRARVVRERAEPSQTTRSQTVEREARAPERSAVADETHRASRAAETVDRKAIRRFGMVWKTFRRLASPGSAVAQQAGWWRRPKRRSRTRRQTRGRIAGWSAMAEPAGRRRPASLDRRHNWRPAQAVRASRRAVASAIRQTASQEAERRSGSGLDA